MSFTITQTEVITKALVPTVDISPFLEDPNSPESIKIIETVRNACSETGFLQITGHAVSKEIVRDLFQASRRFFALPMEAKMRLDCRITAGHRGYDVLASQTYDPDVPPDLKEGFYVGHDLPIEDPMVRQGRFFMGPNVWPEYDSLASEQFRKPVESYHAAINSLALDMLRLVACTLPYGPNVFSEFTTGYVIAPLRLLHYPPARVTNDDGDARFQYGAGAHTDFGAITLLLQDEQPGLEVWDGRAGEFIPVDPTPGAFVVNVGDMLSAWTGGRYKSSIHRVINKNPVDRYSAAFFFDGSLDCSLHPLDGSIKSDLTVEKHMIKRITDSYGKTQKVSIGADSQWRDFNSGHGSR